jgi:hypothetical protein
LTSLDEDARQQILDEDNLQLLRIGYFISAGLTLFGAVIIMGYTFFISIVFAQIAKTPDMAGFPPMFGKLIGAFGLVFGLFVIGIAVLKFVTAQQLKKRRSRIFCLVIAGITCLSIPYGTFLGVCTFIVLLRPTVKRTFEDVRS